MAEIDLGYTDLDQAPERESFEPVPKNRYSLQLIEADVVPTSDQTGRRFTYKAEIIEGPNKGRKMGGGINIINKNPTAQKIGQAELAELVKALKLPAIPRNTGEMLYIPFTGDVDIRQPDIDPQTKQPKINPKNGKPYTAQNEITKFMLYGGKDVPAKTPGSGAAQSGQTAATQAPAATTETKGNRPWD